MTEDDYVTPPSTPGVGDEIPVFRRQTGFHNWNRYAAVNDEFVPIHMDDEAGRAAGMPTAFGMGNLQWSYLHNLLRNWLGDDGSILTIACQFRAPNIKGQTLSARGVVKEVRDENGGQVVGLDVWIEDEDGKVLSPGHASVALP
jgi:acyl dehydratase